MDTELKGQLSVTSKRTRAARIMSQVRDTWNRMMFPRRSLAFPLVLGIAMICLLIVVIVGWILVTVWGASRDDGTSIYWVWLILGTVILCLILAGVAFYLSFLVNSIRVSLRQANFIDAVTHELKSPIASLRLGIETLSRRQLSTEDMEKFTRAMKKDVSRLDRLISHLLDAAGLNVAQESPAQEVFDVRDIIQDCISDVCTYHDFPEQRIDLKSESVLQLGAIQDYEIIFRNLIDNAVKYSGDPPLIQIRVECKTKNGKPNKISVLIENNGASVPESEKKRVFGRFERTERELERTKPGVGLGLYIVQILVKRNAGLISLETPDSGEGTRVVIELPCRSNESDDVSMDEDLNAEPNDRVTSQIQSSEAMQEYDSVERRV